MTKTSKGLSESVHHYLDDSRGQYIPRDFARGTRRECIEYDKPEDLDYLARGPGGCLDEDSTLAEGETIRGEFYWDTWQSVLDNAILVDPDNGNRFRLYQDGSLFLVPEDWDWNEDTESFEPPESETLRRYELPAYWACALVNGDYSGTSDEDSQAIDKFLESEGLKDWSCSDVSERTWFARSNDATNLGGDVARYTFIKF